MTYTFVQAIQISTSSLPAVVVEHSTTHHKYVVLSLKKGGENVCFVTDFQFLLQTQHWNVDNGGYAGRSNNGSRICMHQDVFAQANTDVRNSDSSMSIDHINTLKFDNRAKNLRRATKTEQAMNRDVYGITNIPDDMKELFRVQGECKYPRSIRFDKTEDKFTFSDHVLARKFSGNATGTKSSLYSHAVKFVNILHKYITMLEENTQSPLRPSADLRSKLTNGVYQILSVANNHDPLVFPIPYPQPLIEEDDLPFAKRLLTKFKPFADGEVTSATKKLGHEDLYCEDDDLFVRLKGLQENGVVFDKKHAVAMAKVNWDAKDLRIHVSPKLLAQFPSISTKLPNLKKIHLNEFVFVILEGNNAVPSDHLLVPFNSEANDVRVANIKVALGTYRSYKPSNFRLPEGMDIGVKYLPRNLKLTTDREYNDNEKKYVFVVTINQIIKKFTFRFRDAKQVFETSVVPLLGVNWMDEHSIIVESLRSYDNNAKIQI